MQPDYNFDEHFDTVILIRFCVTCNNKYSHMQQQGFLYDYHTSNSRLCMGVNGEALQLHAVRIF